MGWQGASESCTINSKTVQDIDMVSTTTWFLTASRILFTVVDDLQRPLNVISHMLVHLI